MGLKYINCQVIQISLDLVSIVFLLRYSSGHLANSTAALAIMSRMPAENVVKDHQGGPRVYGLRHWSQNSPSICIEMAQDRRVWSAAVRDPANALETDHHRPG